MTEDKQPFLTFEEEQGIKESAMRQQLGKKEVYDGILHKPPTKESTVPCTTYYYRCEVNRPPLAKMGYTVLECARVEQQAVMPTGSGYTVKSINKDHELYDFLRTRRRNLLNDGYFLILKYERIVDGQYESERRVYPMVESIYNMLLSQGKQHSAIYSLYKTPYGQLRLLEIRAFESVGA